MTTQAYPRSAERGYISAPEPGGRMSAELGGAMPSGSLEVTITPTYVYLWNRDTRERSVFAMHIARAKMNEKFPWNHPRMALDYAWQSDTPSEPPWRGTATCPLHPDRPEREEYTRLGYPICDRIELPNEGDALRHLQRKHKDTFELIEKATALARHELEVETTKSFNERLLTVMERMGFPETAKQEAIEIVKEETTEEDVWQFERNESTTEITTITGNDTATFTHLDFPIKTHPHRYGKQMGSQCKQSGCAEVRKVAFKARKKK